MDITKMTETELKVLAFDLIRQRDITLANLTAVLQELEKREKENE
jgi:hypothetical protein